MDGSSPGRIPPQAGSLDADSEILTGIHRWKPEATYRSHPKLTNALGQAGVVLSPREVVLWRLQLTLHYSRKRHYQCLSGVANFRLQPNGQPKRHP